MIGEIVVVVSKEGCMVSVRSKKSFIREHGSNANALVNIPYKTFGSTQLNETIAFDIYAGRRTIKGVLAMEMMV
jgi:hypothetical protein